MRWYEGGGWHTILHGRIWWRVHEKRSRLRVKRGVGEVARELVHSNVHLILRRKFDWWLIRLENVSRPCCWDGDARTAPGVHQGRISKGGYGRGKKEA